MIVEVQEYVAERGELLRDQVRKLRETSAESVRDALTGSAETIKSFKSPVRALARSGIKLTTVSQEAVQNLIELQSDVVTSALTDVALRLERATKADNLVELVREQIELTPATRARVVEDATRAVTILKTAGRDVRNVAMHTIELIYDKGKEEGAAAKPARRKTAKRATRKSPARARKTAAAAA
ncbi:MAG TPA: TIGR01841 family phasin [Steroidobacteraceae bacterium]|nr:TIGR01841 family phasin [Steroidobacteraceae bacterium]